MSVPWINEHEDEDFICYAKLCVKDRFDEAIVHLNRALEKVRLRGPKEQSALVLTMIGKTHFFAGRKKEAEISFLEAERELDSQQTRWHIAEFYWEIGKDRDPAIRWLRRVIDLSAKTPPSTKLEKHYAETSRVLLEELLNNP
jgi:tetratricopeptide (TPR) repeat protein